MDFNQVRYFLALADSLNFTRAAEKCHVSQPALTQSIKRLEHELGGELIHRDGRFTELTVLGKSLRVHFEQINRTRELVHRTAKATTAGEVDEINIGLMCTIGPKLLVGMLEDFQRQHPGISIILHDVTSDAIEEVLTSGAIDGLFCAVRGARSPRLQYTDLFEESMVVAFPSDHDFADQLRVDLKSIANNATSIACTANSARSSSILFPTRGSSLTWSFAASEKTGFKG